MATSTIDRERLAKLIPLLSSDQPGEVAAAAQAIARTLRRSGADWHDLTAALTATAKPRSRREVVPPDERRVRALERYVEEQRRAIREYLATIDVVSAALQDHRLTAERTRLAQLIAARGTVSKNLDAPPPAWISPTERRRIAVVHLVRTSGDTISDREIARRVGCSPSTVGNVRRRFESARG